MRKEWAQIDYGSEGREFESSAARHINKGLSTFQCVDKTRKYRHVFFKSGDLIARVNFEGPISHHSLPYVYQTFILNISGNGTILFKDHHFDGGAV